MLFFVLFAGARDESAPKTVPFRGTFSRAQYEEKKRQDAVAEQKRRAEKETRALDTRLAEMRRAVQIEQDKFLRLSKQNARVRLCRLS